MIAIWSPTATGKTMVAVNLAAVMSKLYPTALVDLSSDNAVYTWLNCQTAGLQSLIEGDPGGCYIPVNTNLKVYSSEPGTKNVYNGEASILSAISKNLNEHNVIFDTPRDYLRAANIISLSDITIIVTDFNIHGTLLLQKYIKRIPNPLFVLNRYGNYPSITNPVKILQQEMLQIPDDSAEIMKCILVGSPSVKYQDLFKTLMVKVVGEID